MEAFFVLLMSFIYLFRAIFGKRDEDD